MHSIPRSLATFQSYSQPILNAVRNPRGLFSHTTNSGSNLSPENILNRMRNLNSQQLVSAGVVTAEVLGFFTVGEMLGRFKVVGYRSDQEHHETATPHH
jgi:F-type H+-transporting ATPase subunit g